MFAWLPIEFMIHDRQTEHYDIINGRNNAGNPTEFMVFMLDVVKNVLRENDMSEMMT